MSTDQDSPEHLNKIRPCDPTTTIGAQESFRKMRKFHIRLLLAQHTGREHEFRATDAFGDVDYIVLVGWRPDLFALPASERVDYGNGRRRLSLLLVFPLLLFLFLEPVG